MELIRQLDLLSFVAVKWFGGLTCDFWAKFEEFIFRECCFPKKLANAESLLLS
jgi:hypothetical protein